jgi:hypothetical protein
LPTSAFGQELPYKKAPSAAGGKPLTKAPASAVRFVGNGANIVYIDWDNDLVVVVRWIKNEAALNEFIGRVIGATRAAN